MSDQLANAQDARYNQEMNMWQQAQSMPGNPWASAAGQILPMMMMAYGGGGGTPPPYYGAAQTYNPGMTNMGYMG